MSDNDFAYFFHLYVARVWSATAALRQQTHHPFGSCLARNPQLLGGTDSCHDCESEVLDTLWRMYRAQQSGPSATPARSITLHRADGTPRVLSTETPAASGPNTTTPEPQPARAPSTTEIRNTVLTIRREAAVEAGMAARPERDLRTAGWAAPLRTRAWVVEVLIRVVQFARHQDPCSTDLPYDAIAAAVELPEGQPMHTSVWQALGMLLQCRPNWYAANVEEPLSQREVWVRAHRLDAEPYGDAHPALAGHRHSDFLPRRRVDTHLALRRSARNCASAAAASQSSWLHDVMLVAATVAAELAAAGSGTALEVAVDQAIGGAGELALVRNVAQRCTPRRLAPGSDDAAFLRCVEARLAAGLSLQTGVTVTESSRAVA